MRSDASAILNARARDGFGPKHHRPYRAPPKHPPHAPIETVYQVHISLAADHPENLTGTRCLLEYTVGSAHLGSTVAQLERRLGKGCVSYKPHSVETPENVIFAVEKACGIR